MVQKYITVRTSDISGEELGADGGETITFAVGRSSYVIDLTNDELGAFYDALKPYTDVARKGEAGSRPVAAPKGPKRDLKAIRDWAAANGIEVSSRGRIPATVTDAYDAAN